MLIEMLNIIIARLDNMEKMTESIAAMVRRHVHYGVRPAHYKMVGNAMLWTLKQGLGNDWTPEIESAWIKCYTAISDTMINAAKESTVR
jgi:nitric oxide dioxygenase